MKAKILRIFLEDLRFITVDLIFTAKIGFYVGIITIRFLVILIFFSSKSEKKKLVIFSKINSGFSAKLVFPPLDVSIVVIVIIERKNIHLHQQEKYHLQCFLLFLAAFVAATFCSADGVLVFSVM